MYGGEPGDKAIVYVHVLTVAHMHTHTHTHTHTHCRRVTQQDLMEAAEEEVGKESTRTSFRRQDSDAARMYN